MSKGESRYSSEGRQVVRFDNKPIPRGPYGLMLEKGGLEVKKSEEKGPDAIPYINTHWRALKTAAKEGQKDRLVFHKIFLSLKPGSDGVIMPERGGGLTELCRAFGEEADFSFLTLTKEDGSTEDYLDSEEVLAYLEGKVGEVLTAEVIIETAKDRQGNVIKGHPGNNKIANWELQEGGMTGDKPKASAAVVAQANAPKNGKAPLASKRK